MVKMQNFICKTVGVAGMSIALYDAYSLACKKSDRVTQVDNANHYADAYFSTRTLNSESEFNGAIQNKIRNMRMKNPIVPIIGKVKGFMTGALDSLSNNFIPIAFSTLALTTKGTLSKIGAWGVGIYGAITILREGFGFGKPRPKI